MLVSEKMKYMKVQKVQKVHLPQLIPNLGEAMPVPAHVAYIIDIVVPKAEPLTVVPSLEH